MTAEQFDVLAELLRAKPETPSSKAARAVLVDGTTQADAMRQCGSSRAAVGNAVARMRNAEAKILRVFSPQQSR